MAQPQPITVGVSGEEAAPSIGSLEVRLGWDISPRAALILLVGAVLLGAAVRVVPFGGRAFPLNDGGLVYELVTALVNNGFQVPFAVNYNGLEIPFAYPPVAIYLIGACSTVLQIPVPYAESFVAVGAAVLAIPMVYLVALRLGSGRQTAVGAAYVFALVPNAFQWLETGGGAARSVALLLSLFAIHQALRTFREPQWVRAANCGILTGLTVLTATRGALLLLVSLAILAVFLARRRALIPLTGVWLAAAALTTWAFLNVIISRHGVEVITSTLFAGSDPTTSLKTLLSFSWSGTPILDVGSILAVVGFAAVILERRFLFPIWFLVLFVLDQRSGITYAMVPMSLMASHAATNMVLRWPEALHLRQVAHRRWDRLATAALAAVIVEVAVVGATTARVGPDTPLRAVDDGQLASMIWVRDHLNPESRFVVVSPSRWETDAYGSWFPAVSTMQNLDAVQGYEWLGLDAYTRQQGRHADIQACVAHTIDCVETWIRTQGLAVDYVLIPKNPPGRADCCAAARESMLTSPHFHVVYDGPGATIASVAGSAASADPVLVGAGDIAACDSRGAASTAALVAATPGTVFTLGDNAYETGSEDQFASCYDPTWGAFKDRTKPLPGNHDYYTSDAAPYYAYFGGSAGLPTEGWYSFDIGSWHVVMLNSNCTAIGGCGPGSRELTWLTDDLATHPAACTIAMWHHPLFTSGTEGPSPDVQDLWRALYAEGAEIILNGHEHSYQRFAPMTPDGELDPARGIREFIVGTGGRNLLPFVRTAPNTEVRDDSTFGVLKLTLHASSYDWQFVPVVLGGFSDRGTGSCH